MLKGNKKFLWDLQGPDEMGEDGKAAAANPAMPGADPGLSSPRPLLRHGSAPGTQSLARSLVAEAWCRPVQWMSTVVYSRSPVELRHLWRRWDNQSKATHRLKSDLLGDAELPPRGALLVGEVMVSSGCASSAAQAFVSEGWRRLRKFILCCRCSVFNSWLIKVSWAFYLWD